MELNTNDNYEQEPMNYESRPNPNDALFGGIGTDEPYQVTSTYTSYSAPKNNTGKNIIIIVIALMIVAVVGFVVMKMQKDKNKYDGKYELTKASYMGVTMEVDQLEAMSNTTMEATLDITGKTAYFDINNNGVKQGGRCNITIDGSSITLEDAYETIYGTYDEDTNTITLKTNGADLIFEKVD